MHFDQARGFLWMLFWCVGLLGRVWAAPDLSVEITAFPAEPQAGQPLVLRATVTNLGDAAAGNVTLTNILDHRLTADAVQTSGGSYSVTGQWVLLEAGELAPGAWAWIEITTHPGFADWVILSAVTSAAAEETIIFNNSYADQIEVKQGANKLPEARIDTPNAGAELKALVDIPIAAWASDPEGALSKVEIFVNETKIGESAGPGAEAVWRRPLPGNFNIRVVATDSSGLRTTTTRQVQLGSELLPNRCYGPAWAEGEFQVLFLPEAGAVHSVQVSRDLVEWSEVARMGGHSVSALVVDDLATQTRPGFYRAVRITP